MKKSNRWSLSIVVVLTIVMGCTLDNPPPEEPIKESAEKGYSSIPWGAMYTPNEYLTYKGMTGHVKYYCGVKGAQQLLNDLQIAQDHTVTLILTLGRVDPETYLDSNRNIDMNPVLEELTPFFGLADSIQPFIDDGTVWGIRFMDEPHDPKGYPHDFQVDTQQLGEVFSLIKSHFKNVRVGSTSPAFYMIDVPHADFACGQYNHAHPLSNDPVQFFREEAALAHQHGLDYVASLNANTNTVGNYEFFHTYSQMCSIEHVGFVTSWQWPQGHHPYPSFESRLNDPSPRVQAQIAQIPDSCCAKDLTVHTLITLWVTIFLQALIVSSVCQF